MKIIDGSGSVLGRLATVVAKEALRGEEIAVINCEKIIITGNKKTNKKEFERKRSMRGSLFRGPKHDATSEKVVKRAIRGMLPNFREGRGRIAFKKIRCYKGIPKEFEKEKPVKIDTGKKIKFTQIKEFTR